MRGVYLFLFFVVTFCVSSDALKCYQCTDFESLMITCPPLPKDCDPPSDVCFTNTRKNRAYTLNCGLKSQWIDDWGYKMGCVQPSNTTIHPESKSIYVCDTGRCNGDYRTKKLSPKSLGSFVWPWPVWRLTFISFLYFICA